MGSGGPAKPGSVQKVKVTNEGGDFKDWRLKTGQQYFGRSREIIKQLY